MIKKIMLLQIAFLLLVGIFVYVLYPKAEVNLNGDFVRISSVNAKVIMLSENPDFSNPRYIDLENISKVSLKLNPGKYYWKPYNGFIEGFGGKFEVDSKVAMSINNTENESELVNVGNVRISVRKNKEGMMVGRVILEPEESETVEDNGTYEGRQDG